MHPPSPFCACLPAVFYPNLRTYLLTYVLPSLHTDRSSVDEVIGLLSGPAVDGSFEDEASRQQYDPAQFDSWRNSLTKVCTYTNLEIDARSRLLGGLVCKKF